MVLRPGVYRVEVNEAGDTTVITVRGGDGETTADGKAAPLHVNEQVVMRGATNPSYDRHPAPRTDEFDAWGADRDRRSDSSVSVRYVAPGVVGVTDLDVAGAWRPAPVYGNVWFPHTVVADWAPYRFGHWGFVAPWGWTWIDDAPWGYAPFHYGRWVMVGGAWGWAPGPIAVRAVYAPALVSFIGGVEVVGVVDPVSWVALSWGEPWYPSFGVSYGYYNSVNLCGSIFGAGIIAGVWGGAAVNLAYGHDYRAVNVVGRDGFAGGHGVGREFAHRDRFGGHAFDHAGSRREGVRGIGASREGRFGGHAPLRAGSHGIPPRGAMGRSAVTRHEPGAAGHGGGFRGAGVAAKHGPSANAGHAGSFNHVSNNGHAVGAPSHNSTPAGGSKVGSAVTHNTTPAGGSKAGSAVTHNTTPAGGSKVGRAVTHNTTPAGASKVSSASAATHSTTPAGGSKLGNTNHSGMGGAGAGSTGRSGIGGAASGVGRSGSSGIGSAVGGVGHSTPSGGGAAARGPVGGVGHAPSGGGAPTHKK